MIEIDHWQLQVPQMSRVDAERLAREVAAILGEAMPDLDHTTGDLSLSEVALKVEWARGMSLEQLAERIAGSLLNTLTEGGH